MKLITEYPKTSILPLEAALFCIDCGCAVSPGISPAMLAGPEKLQRLRERKGVGARIAYWFAVRLCKVRLSPHFILFPITTKERAIKWFGRDKNSNVLIMLGRKSGIVELDADSTQNANGEHAAEGNKYSTCQLSTGTGEHYYFKYPNGLNWFRHVTDDGINLRGDRCWSIVPPSIHANGRAYKWVDATQPIMELPEALLASRKMFISNQSLFIICLMLHNAVYRYIVYPLLKLYIEKLV